MEAVIQMILRMLNAHKQLSLKQSPFIMLLVIFTWHENLLAT